MLFTMFGKFFSASGNLRQKSSEFGLETYFPANLKFITINCSQMRSIPVCIEFIVIINCEKSPSSPECFVLGAHLNK